MAALLMAGLALCPLAHAQVTKRNDEVGRMVNTWFSEGLAGGLGGVFYENRDGGHSPFPVADWPQLQSFTADAEVKNGTNKGPAQFIRPFVTIGNASMAAPPDKGGCLPRLYYHDSNGLKFLTNQYLNNNIFFYPVHHDNDPGWNGVRGWGDLLPCNTPCLVISQGSSGTDQPFLRAFISALAALPPDTQRALVRNHTLMPALQSLFRRSNKMVRADEDYFTGRAHPPVFRGDQIDEPRFVELAHQLTPLAIPPVAFLEVVDEAPVLVPGRDFFELPQVTSERLADTPFTIARIFRGTSFRRTITVSAKRSAMFSSLPLQFRWAVLQGDLSRIRIEPSKDGTEAKITVAWHPELRSSAGVPSHRVDIGVFASNGLTWSAPAFVSFYMIPSEDRFYSADGRLDEICHEAGNPDPGAPAADDLRWLWLGRSFSTKDDSPGVRMLRERLEGGIVETLKKAADDLSKAQEEWRELNKDATKKTEAGSALQKLRSEIKRRVEGKVRDAVGLALIAVAESPEMFVSIQDEVAELVKRSPSPNAAQDLAAALQRAADFLVLEEHSGGRLVLRRNPEIMRAGDRAQMRTLHLTVLATALLPEFIERSNAPAWVDPRIATRKEWRDIHHYSKDGACTGWTRISGGRQHEFDSIGQLLPDGPGGRAVRVKLVRDEKSSRLVFAPE